MRPVCQTLLDKDTRLIYVPLIHDSLVFMRAQAKFCSCLAMKERYFPFAEGRKSITPEIAGWKYCGLEIVEIRAGEIFILGPEILAHSEGSLIPLNAVDIQVTVDEEIFSLVGRKGVFTGSTDWLYLSPGSRVEITSKGGSEIALATSLAEKKFKSCYVDALKEIEVRGAGDATREVRPFMHPDIYQQADRLMAVELVTPDGNVSSYPPHRHDGMGDCSTSNEEIYYFRIGKGKSPHGDPEGFGLHRTYSGPEDANPFDDNIAVRDGDIYLVPRGYHGPCVALPGYPMYYLNVLAGDTRPRSMDFCDSPDHAWIRESWKKLSQDPRVPWKAD